MNYGEFVVSILATTCATCLLVLWFNEDKIGCEIKNALNLDQSSNEMFDYFLNCNLCQSVWVGFAISLLLHWKTGNFSMFFEATAISLFTVRGLLELWDRL